MRWSWKLGRIAGIDIYVHATFLLIIVFVAYSHLSRGEGWTAAINGVVFILALFGCIVLHELGHALTARRFGIKTRDITLLPIGGLARLERMPDKPMQEFWVAIAGPAVNFAIAIVLLAGLVFTDLLLPVDTLSITGGPFLERLMFVNVALAVFNLLPAFPMDGGRVVRALLATQLPYARATSIAATLGQGMAFLFGLLGLIAGNPFLLFIALFVWIGAAQEAGLAQAKSTLGGVPVSRAMLTDFRVLAPTDPLSHAVALILGGSQHDFPVVVGSQVVGVLTRASLMAALARDEQTTPVEHVMRREFPTADPSEPLEETFARLSGSDVTLIPVLRQGVLVGLLTAENVSEFLMIEAALGKHRTAATTP